MSKIEETRREMYRLLAHLKSNPTGVVLMAEFESAMEAHLEVLRQKAKRGARIAELKAGLRAAVRDNQRLRKDRKAFIETQDEHLAMIHRIGVATDRLVGLCELTGSTICNDPSPLREYMVIALQEKAQEFKQ